MITSRLVYYFGRKKTCYISTGWSGVRTKAFQQKILLFSLGKVKLLYWKLFFKQFSNRRDVNSFCITVCWLGSDGNDRGIQSAILRHLKIRQATGCLCQLGLVWKMPHKMHRTFKSNFVFNLPWRESQACKTLHISCI